MVYIQESFPGREDGSYTLLFGDEQIGSLISAVHATAIRMGTELEHLVTELAQTIDNSNLDAFFNKTLKPGVYVIPKKTMKDKRLRFDQQPDVIVVNVTQNSCKVIEIKLGDQFDTKKSAGEVENLKLYADKLNRATNYRVSYAICMWYAKDKAAVITGFKGTISPAEALTGAEFCQMVGISYKDINARIAQNQKANRDFLFSKVHELQGRY
jgi:hypothetical protein